MYNYLFYLLYLIIILFLILYIYKLFINNYFIENDHINYDKYKDCIQYVSKENFYMNYGYWDNQNLKLEQANENLINYMLILIKESIVEDNSIRLLDIGCGYGIQDFYWIKNLPNNTKITAIDISKNQINSAKSKINSSYMGKLDFIECDAMNIHNQFENQQFDCIVSLESAFHYKNRNVFFKHVRKLLKNDGTFIIADIVLSNPTNDESIFKMCSMKLFVKLFSDFFNIPSENLITEKEWNIQINNSGFKMKESYNLTKNTFIPYYKYYFKEYIKNLNYSDYIAKTLINIFSYCQPFSYVVATYN